MGLTPRENYLRNASMARPDYMPVGVHISNASWDQLREELEDVVTRHPRIWPGFQRGQRNYEHFRFGPAHQAGEPFRDAWGCVWETSMNGIEGVVTQHPLATWDAWEKYAVPDPIATGDRGPVDWAWLREEMDRRKAAGELASGGPPHGFHFMRLTYLRGFEDLMVDMAMEEPRLDELVEALYDHNRTIVDEFLDMDVDMISLAEDLGSQGASIISPAMFRRYCKPSYERLIAPCRARAKHVYLHSDGYIMDLLDDLIVAGVTILNPQDLCNGIDNLRRELKGRVCISLDVDRQTTVPYGSPAEIRELVEEEVRTLGSPDGGLELVAGIYPPTPPGNIDALASAFEEFQTYWFEGKRAR